MHENILVVEDEAELSEALALFLSREGYIVATAADAPLPSLRDTGRGNDRCLPAVREAGSAER